MAPRREALDLERLERRVRLEQPPAVQAALGRRGGGAGSAGAAGARAAGRLGVREDVAQLGGRRGAGRRQQRLAVDLDVLLARLVAGRARHQRAPRARGVGHAEADLPDRDAGAAERGVVLRHERRDGRAQRARDARLVLGVVERQQRQHGEEEVHPVGAAGGAVVGRRARQLLEAVDERLLELVDGGGRDGGRVARVLRREQRGVPELAHLAAQEQPLERRRLGVAVGARVEVPLAVAARHVEHVLRRELVELEQARDGALDLAQEGVVAEGARRGVPHKARAQRHRRHARREHRHAADLQAAQRGRRVGDGRGDALRRRLRRAAGAQRRGAAGAGAVADVVADQLGRREDLDVGLGGAERAGREQLLGRRRQLERLGAAHGDVQHAAVALGAEAGHRGLDRGQRVGELRQRGDDEERADAVARGRGVGEARVVVDPRRDDAPAAGADRDLRLAQQEGVVDALDVRQQRAVLQRGVLVVDDERRERLLDGRGRRDERLDLVLDVRRDGAAARRALRRRRVRDAGEAVREAERAAARAADADAALDREAALERRARRQQRVEAGVDALADRRLARDDLEVGAVAVRRLVVRRLRGLRLLLRRRGGGRRRRERRHHRGRRGRRELAVGDAEHVEAGQRARDDGAHVRQQRHLEQLLRAQRDLGARLGRQRREAPQQPAVRHRARQHERREHALDELELERQALVRHDEVEDGLVVVRVRLAQRVDHLLLGRAGLLELLLDRGERLEQVADDAVRVLLLAARVRLGDAHERLERRLQHRALGGRRGADGLAQDAHELAAGELGGGLVELELRRELELVLRDDLLCCVVLVIS